MMFRYPGARRISASLSKISPGVAGIYLTALLMTAGSAFCLTAAPVMAAGSDAAGKSLFEEQCIACHTATAADNGGNQGPTLIGLIGRRAAADAEFSYTKALRDYQVIWDAATLDKFLSAPDSVVPGTAMVIAVPNQADRDNLIAYLQSVTSR